MDATLRSRFHRALGALFAAVSLAPLTTQALQAGVRGVFDFPLEVAAAAASGHADSQPPRMVCYEVTIPVSFRATKGRAADVVQIEIELTCNDEEVLVLDYEPQTTLTGDVVGEIEETITTEDASGVKAAVGASLPIPGLEAAQIGPSVDYSNSARTVRTQKLHRQPQLAAIVVAGSTARGRGVFFQLRPAPDVTLEGAQPLTLHIAAPRSFRTASLTIKCRAKAKEDWLLFEREAEIASARGKVTVALLPNASGHETTLHTPERPCPLCDARP
jgi:hypothetical protein